MKIILMVFGWGKKKFMNLNFFRYLIAGGIFTLSQVLLVWIFVDFVIIFPEKINTPLATFIITCFLFIFKYLFYEWIGFTKK